MLRSVTHHQPKVSKLVLDILRKEGPKTSRSVFAACQAANLEAPKTPYYPPHQRVYPFGAKSGPAPGVESRAELQQAIRSMRQIKSTLRALEQRGQVTQMTIQKWNNIVKESKIPELIQQASDIEKSLKQSGESSFVWVDGGVREQAVGATIRAKSPKVIRSQATTQQASS